MRKEFNPLEWNNNTDTNNLFAPTKKNEEAPKNDESLSDVEEIIQRIEQGNIDITKEYANWRDLGFALSHEFGEKGREYFHRVSKFYPEYSASDCDKQYDKCLKSNNSGITLKSFFHLAKLEGVNIATKPVVKQEEEKLPLIPDAVYKSLPEFLQRVCSVAQSKHERDILLLGAVTTLSSCIPSVYGLYDNRKVYANLYLFVSAKASAGKGLLNHCRELVAPVHKELREESILLKEQYERELNEYNAQKKKNPEAVKPVKPPEKMLFIPANSSATGVFQLLHDNDAKGLIFETEGDTLANTFKSDYGNYSDGFRKAFHHETISYYRRTDREYVDINKPCLSAVLSGTPKQIVNLVPDAENGLFSRFMFYYLELKNKWKNVFAQVSDNGLDDYFENLGNEYYDLFTSLKTSLDIQFTLTEEQQNQFNEVFASLQDNYSKLLGDDYMATVRRLGLVAFRLAMIFSVIRIMEHGSMPQKLVCEQADFNNAMSIIKVLVVHAKKVFTDLPIPEQQPKRKNRKQKFFDKLPHTFTRQEYADIAKQLDISDKSAQSYITSFVNDGLLERVKNGEYIKLLIEEIEDSKDTED